jgi:hypothetical protein
MMIAQSFHWATVAMAVMGLLSLFLGYRLFCGGKSARAALITNLLAGGLLTIFGIAILIADFHTVQAHPAKRSEPSWQRKSLVMPKNPSARRPIDRFV